jgi:ferrous-iron efflux pump FieF
MTVALPSSADHGRLRRRAAYASILVAILLIFAKLFAYFLTDSIAMLSTLLDSTLDLLGSLVTAFGIATALNPPDHDHRFGHGKAEPLAALAQAAFIIGSSVLLGYEALGRFYRPHTVHNDIIAYAVSGFSALAILALVGFQGRVVRRTRSLAIGADRLHYMNDLVINLAVIAAFALYDYFKFDWLDPAFALVIAAGLSISAYKIARRALDALMDKELPDAERDRIRAIVTAQPGIFGLYRMRTRTDSDRIFVELHIEMDGALPLRQAHQAGENVAAAIRQEFPNADILLHEDPDGVHKESWRPRQRES